MKKHLLTVLTVLCLCCLCFSLVSVSATEQSEPSYETFRVRESASIRTEKPMGLRFTAEISASEYASIIETYPNAEFGIIILPQYIAEGKNVEFGSTDLRCHEEGTVEEDANFFQYRVGLPQLNGEVYEFTCSLVNISESNYEKPFMAKAYIKLGDSNYVYSAPYARSIYTVATYAVEESESYEDYATEYLENIISDVESRYTRSSALLYSDAELFAEKTFYVGDRFTVKGFVSDGENSIEANIVLSENNGLIEKVGLNEYEVVGVGTFELYAARGDKPVTDTSFLEGYKSIEVPESSETALLVSEEDLAAGNIIIGPKAQLTYVKEGEFAGSFHWKILSGHAGSLDITNENSAGLQFAEEKCSGLFKSGSYIYFDVYATGITTLASTIGSNGAPLFLYNKSSTSAAATPIFKHYVSGIEVNNNLSLQALNSDYLNTWITFEIYLTADCDWFMGGRNVLALYTDTENYTNDIYLRNIVVTKEKRQTEDGPIYRFMDDPENIGQFIDKGAQASFSYDPDAQLGGRIGAYRYTAQTDTITPLADNGAFYFKNTVTWELLKKDRILYFDLYVENMAALKFALDGQEILLYGNRNNAGREWDNAKYTVNTYVDGVKDDGVDLWGGSAYYNKWITFEIIFHEDAVQGLDPNNYICYANTTFTPVYFDNFIVTDSPLYN